MINEQEMSQLNLMVGHTQVNRPKSRGKQEKRITGSLFRECITTLTRL